MGAERIGLLGGTFDPPHRGHLAAARACRDALSLGRVLLVVANDPWQKSPRRRITPAGQRFEMVAALAAGEPGVEASRMEIDRGGPSYTVDTVAALRAEAAGRGSATPDVFVIVGADLVAGLATWERVEELRRTATLVVVTRPHSPAVVPPVGWRCEVVDGGGVDASSSEIRRRLAAGEPVGEMVPEAVMRCIRQRHLYAVPR